MITNKPKELAREILKDDELSEERFDSLSKQLAQMVLEQKPLYVGIDYALGYLEEVREKARQEQKEKDAEIVELYFGDDFNVELQCHIADSIRNNSQGD